MEAPTMELQVQVFSRTVNPNAIWPIVVNRGISFGDLKAIVAVQFGLQGHLIFFRHKSQVGSDSKQAIMDILENHDLLLVQEVLVDISSNPWVARMPSLETRGPSTSRRWPLPEKAEVVQTEAYTDERVPYCVIPTQSSKGTNALKRRNALSKSGNVSGNDCDLQEAIRRSVIAAQPNANCHPMSNLSLINPGFYSPPLTQPQNDSIGHVIAQGSTSQYTLEGGRSACTSISLLACSRLLSDGMNSSLAGIDALALDEFVEQGVLRYRALQGSHSSLEDVWKLPDFSHLVKNLQKGETFQGSVSRRQDLLDVFQGCLDFAFDCERLAIVLTKAGETVLCVTDINNEPTKWYLFDSHGQSHEDPKLSYWKEFNSLYRLLDAFLIKYPPQKFGDGSLQSEMYNLFEACPVILRPDCKMKPEALPMESDEAKIEGSSRSLPAENVAAADVARASFDSPEDRTDTPQSHLPSDLFDVSNYQCAISMEIMADPVVSSDGKIYDRPNIEEHFDTRRAEEERRIAEEEVRARGEEVNESREATDCCRCPGARPPIELTSPITNEIVSGILTPVHFIEQQIVCLVESNAFMMTDEELEDWHERRAQKKESDEARREEERIAREREEEMRRNAEEAEQRRAEEEQQPPLPEEPWLQVRVDRDTNDESERLGGEDLGISVVLSDKIHRIPAGYASQGNNAPRCMVACCSAPLSSNVWCARCARLTCDDCLRFGVTNIETVSGDLHRICFECVSQIVDAMDSEDIRIRQKRAILLSNLERHLTLLSNRAATKQDSIVRHEVHDEYGGRTEKVECAIDRLENQLRTLHQRVHDEERRAAEAAADEGLEHSSKSGNLTELREQCEALEQEYEECLQESEPSDDDECLQGMLRRSSLSHRLEIARTNLAMAESSAGSARDNTESETQQQIDTLRRRLEEITSSDGQETEEEEIARVCEISDIYTRLDELDVRLGMERSVECPPASATESLPALRMLLSELQQHVGRTGRFRRIFRNKRNDLTSCMADLRAACNALAESSEQNPANMEESMAQVNELLLRVGQQSGSLPQPIQDRLREALSELERLRMRHFSRDEAQDPPQAHNSSTDLEEEDILVEFVRLSAQDVSCLSFDEQVSHVARLSELDGVLHEAEAELFRNQQEELPSTASVVDARQDIMAIGSRLTGWPLPLGLEYPTERMERQLEVLQNALELRLVESKRSAEAFMSERHNALVTRREELEDEVANTGRALEDAESNAREEEERQLERAERRRQEEQARQAREQALREEAERARQAAEELRRQHGEAEAATLEAFTNARAEGGARSLGGIGDLRMCRRCRAGPIENMACADLRTHNNTATDYKGRRVASVRNPNACPRCGWHNSDWRNWPYWDGTYGPH